jgi:antitoxin HicB
LTYFAYVHEAEPGAWLVLFYDVPEAIAQGDSYDEAIAAAPDALAAALEGYLELGRAFPERAEISAQSAPGYRRAEIPVDPQVAARGLLAAAMRAQGVSKVGLARLMGRDEKVARRIVAGQNTSLDLVLEALRAVGVRPALAA